MNDSFDEEELRTLAFELGIGYDNIAGTTRTGKAREMISALDRQGRIDELYVLCARKRPNIAWPEPPRPVERTQPQQPLVDATMIVEDLRQEQEEDTPYRQDKEGAAGQANCKLILQEDPLPGDIFELTAAEVLVGRAPTVDFVIPTPSVSGRHALFSREKGKYAVEDLNSTNGTFLNGRRLTKREFLKSGDQIRLGQSIILRFEAPSQPAPLAANAVDSSAQASQAEAPLAGAASTQSAAQPQDPGRTRQPHFARWAVVALLALVILIGVAAVALNYFPLSGDPASLEGMIRIPAGTYQIGSGAGGAGHEAAREIALDAYFIDKYEVTNARYADFVDDTGGRSPASWSGGNYAEGQATFPVTGISWDMADAYCKWLNKRLPSEAEWETAARGDQSLLFPWGDSGNQVTLPENSPYPVGTFLPDHSFYGLFDTAYNVHEWVEEPYAEVQSGRKVLRGGSGQLPVDLATRIIGDPNAPTMTPQAGFRCAANAGEETGSVTPDLLFRDDFTDPDSGWTIGSGDNPGYHAPDWYHLEAHTEGPLLLLGPEGNSNRGDLSIETEVFLSLRETINDGDFRYGLIARKSGDQSYYAFMVSPNTTTWSAVKQTPDGPIEIASGRDGSIVGSDLRNWLRLDASGQTFVFWVNGRLAHQFSDPEAPLVGDIGYIVESLGASKTHLHVDFLEVTTLMPNPIPAPTADALQR
jgi:formylglycine-generating enzyme required for sulfatase activity